MASISTILGAILFLRFGYAVGNVGFMGALGLYVPDSLILLLNSLFVLALIIPSLALGARRLHDINRSGWWLLGLLGYVLLVLPGLVMTVILIIWAIKRGDKGPNKYGPDPRQATSQ